MSGANTSDPVDQANDFGSSGTDTVRPTHNAPSDSSGGAGFDAGFQNQLEGTSSVSKRITDLEREVRLLNRFRTDLRSVEANFDNDLYDLFASIKHIDDRVNHVEREIESLDQSPASNTANEGKNSQNEKNTNNNELNHPYIKISQVVFLLLGLGTIGISMGNSAALGTASAVMTPVFFILSFMGVVAERAKIRSEQ